MVEGFLKETHGYICFKKRDEVDEKADCLGLPLIKAYRCPNCGSVQLISK
jgi:hypothetical protein